MLKNYSSQLPPWEPKIQHSMPRHISLSESTKRTSSFSTPNCSSIHSYWRRLTPLHQVFLQLKASRILNLARFSPCPLLATVVLHAVCCGTRLRLPNLSRPRMWREDARQPGNLTQDGHCVSSMKGNECWLCDSKVCPMMWLLFQTLMKSGKE
jgi:hypothetical protein